MRVFTSTFNLYILVGISLLYSSIVHDQAHSNEASGFFFHIAQIFSPATGSYKLFVTKTEELRNTRMETSETAWKN